MPSIDALLIFTISPAPWNTSNLYPALGNLNAYQGEAFAAIQGIIRSHVETYKVIY